MEIRATNRFLKRLRDTTGPDLIRRAILGLSEFLESRADGQITNWPVNCKPILGLSKNWPKLMEWRASIRSRIIFSGMQHPILVDFDLNHASVETLTQEMKADQVLLQMSNAVPFKVEPPMEKRSNPSALDLQSSGDYGSPLFAEEFFDEWVHFLDLEQQAARDTILQVIQSANKPSIQILKGGAGTGKTSVLTNLAFNLEELSVPLSLEVNPGVRSYLQLGDRTVPGLSKPPSVGPSKVVLLDDPISLDTLMARVAQTKSMKQHLVVAIDPTQWHERKLASKWQQFQNETEFTAIELKMAYRQTKGVGRPALDIILNFNKNSSAFVDRGKASDEQNILADTWRLCLEEIEFRNSSGGLSVHEPGWPVKDFGKFLLEVSNRKTEASWPALLVGHEIMHSPPSEIEKLLSGYEKDGFSFHQRHFGKVSEVRGTEYEFVALFVPEEKWKTITTGKYGPGTSEWESINTTLTFLTRAKSHVAVFVMKEHWYR
jgi:hypothetical protein